MQITNKLRERFCKDCNIPIKIFQEPYFTDRMFLLDKYYDVVEKWQRFEKSLSRYANEQDYFEEYNRVKDVAIEAIKSSDAYERFNNEDMNRFAVSEKHRHLPGKDIYHSSNNGRVFVSVDMRKANFSALKSYEQEPNMFQADSWEDFISRFTDNEHIIHSKYIRQVIMGNCNPKRHITYEKHIMDELLTLLETAPELHISDITRDVVRNNVVFFSNDEIVFDLTDKDNPPVIALEIEHTVDLISESLGVPFKTEYFVLEKIHSTDGYIKNLSNGIEFKCLDANMLPFVIRTLQNEPVTDYDKVFVSDGRLAQYIEVPEIAMTQTQEALEQEVIEHDM